MPGSAGTFVVVKLHVREMRLDEVGLVIDYFHDSTPEHLNTLGVDPTRLPEPVAWRELFAGEYDLPIHKRPRLLVIWEADDDPVGFSSADKIVFGEQANMHLHVTQPDDRMRGIGTECVRKSARLYFDALELACLYCEPNAFNVAPNRTLQKVGFKYLKTHMTVPNRLNFHQPVTRWVLDAAPPIPRG